MLELNRPDWAVFVSLCLLRHVHNDILYVPIHASTFILCASNAARTRFWPCRSTAALMICAVVLCCVVRNGCHLFTVCLFLDVGSVLMRFIYLCHNTHTRNASRWCQSQGSAHTIKATFLQFIPAIFLLLNENEQWPQHVALHVSKAFFFVILQHMYLKFLERSHLIPYCYSLTGHRSI